MKAKTLVTLAKTLKLARRILPLALLALAVGGAQLLTDEEPFDGDPVPPDADPF